MEKKEYTHRHLPHFQQPGQAYFVTWCLKDAVPQKAVEEYTFQLKQLRSEIDFLKENGSEEDKINQLKLKYSHVRQKYFNAYENLLHLQTNAIVDLSKPINTQIIINTLCFWEKKRLENYAFCVMKNHVHWVFRTYEINENGNSNYLQDILQSVKRFSAEKINKAENLSGSLWHNESFDTTIRDDFHLNNTIEYTINNPVKAGLVKNWWDWEGTKSF